MRTTTAVGALVILLVLTGATIASAQNITIQVGPAVPYYAPAYGWYGYPYAYQPYPVAPYAWYYPGYYPRYWHWGRRFVAPGPVDGDGEPGKVIWYDKGIFTGMPAPGRMIELFNIEGHTVPLVE